MLVSSHHLSQRGTRKEAPKQGRRREKSKPEREREREQEQLPEMKPGQPASRGRKHKSAGGFAYSEVERRTHTTVQGPAQLSTSEKRGRGTEEEVGPVAAAAAAFPSSRGSPHHAPAAALPLAPSFVSPCLVCPAGNTRRRRRCRWCCGMRVRSLARVFSLRCWCVQQRWLAPLSVQNGRKWNIP